jgi:hypothetical protein
VKGTLALYLWALLPTAALAVEGVILADEKGIDLASVIMQGGIGGLAALVAVKMLLVLYQDKERNTASYNSKLLEVIEAQISVNKDLIASNKELVHVMNEIKVITTDNRTLFLRHIGHSLME